MLKFLVTTTFGITLYKNRINKIYVKKNHHTNKKDICFSKPANNQHTMNLQTGWTSPENSRAGFRSKQLNGQIQGHSGWLNFSHC